RRHNESDQSEKSKSKDYTSACQRIYFLSADLRRDFREDCETEHFRYDGESEKGVQIFISTNIFKVIYSKSFCDLSTKVKCKKKPAKRKRLIVFYNHIHSLPETGFFHFSIQCRFFFYLCHGNPERTNQDDGDHNRKNGIPFFR